MKSASRRTRTPSLLVAVLLLGLWLPDAFPALAQQQGTTIVAAADREIRHLLDYIAGSHCTFIRNDTEYDAKAALKHVQDKYDYYKSDIHSAEDFIRLAATKSLMSGQPYLVRCPGSPAAPAADWLRQELAAYRQDRSQPGNP